jgi:transcriptional regulator with GAF, ATPase, and Fis domain
VSRNKQTPVWYTILSARNQCVEDIFTTIRQHDIELINFDSRTDAAFGIVFVSGNGCYEQLISFLNFQVKLRGNRIIVINTICEPFNNSEVLKILNYGAEYFFESKLISNDTDVITEKINRWRNIESIVQSAAVKNIIAGESKSIKKLLRNIIEVAVYSDASVLIQGERGTGKELVARLIHELQESKVKGEMILLDCTTIRTELSGSEFFGHEKGSYTGADHAREGAFAMAANGTLFLDEVGEMPLVMQAELLRIIQEKTYKKLGSNIWRQASFRLVCATNRDLERECDAGNFRKDLNDRISLWKCCMPLLDERKEDIPLLLDFFLKKKFPAEVPPVDAAVMHYLNERNYPGNVRELQNIIKRICLRYAGKGPITLGDIPEYDRVCKDTPENNWYENADLAASIISALKQGYDARNIVDTIKSLTTKLALGLAGNNREMSLLLGKSERWIQLQRAKEK